MSRIVYEDDALVILDKPAGVSSEGGVPALLRAEQGDPDRYIGVVHRLDTGVSGLMVLAKTPAAAAALSRQIAESQAAYALLDGRAEGGGSGSAPTFIKEYRAVTACGAPLPETGVLRDWLFKDSRRGRVYPVSRPRKGVREAVLEYRLLAEAPAPDGQALCLTWVTLHTGRTHQIRVQLAARRRPLWGDGKYGSRCKGSLALQSARLRFLHPETGEGMEFCLPMPEGEPWGLFWPAHPPFIGVPSG